MTSARATRFEPPVTSLMVSEPWRASADLAAYYRALPSLVRGPQGDGHGVLVIPGLLADDSSTQGIRTVLRRRGYRVRRLGLGPNVGPTPRAVQGMFAALDRMHARTGRPVSLIGWSLGGFFARELARLAPDKVRLVVTLGTPLQLRDDDHPSSSRAGWIYERLRPLHSPFLTGIPHEEDRPPLPVPDTAIYSRLDGVVPWQACLTVPGPTSENIVVRTSHGGMGFRPAVLRILLDRLAQPEGRWRPYTPHPRSRDRRLRREGMAA